MPGFMVHVGATVLCSHAGQAQPTVPNPRVTVNGQPTVAVTGPYAVAGCTLPPPPSGNGPCVAAQWVTGSTRVTSNGQPLVLLDSQAICAPSGTPLMITVTQTRVTAT
jgi:uncharacterized Zn-binding protein involved in type VI secretion